MTDEAKAKEADEFDDADRVDEANEADGGKFNCFGVVDGFAIFLFLLTLVDEVDEADKANEYDKADKVNEATALDEAVDAGIISFSLTKCSAIFAEVKEYFEANNNQLELGFNVQIRLMSRSNSPIQNWRQQRI